MMYHCRFFKGDKPCEFHKTSGAICTDACAFLQPMSGRRLIIKLGAMGDVIRTTPILREIWERYSKSQIWWLTRFPEVIPGRVDVVLPFNLESVLTLEATSFDTIYNLDKDREACALTHRLNALDKFGFTLHQGHPLGLNVEAERKIATGIDDEFSQKNDLSYQQEMFRICWLGEFVSKRHDYVLPSFKKILRPIYVHKGVKGVVGLNTSFGDRWSARRWHLPHWIELCKLLKKENYLVMLLGGKEDEEFNRFLQKETDVFYAGTRYPIMRFAQQLLDACDVVVTPVTATMHLALALKKKVVVLNNIFNKHEFELYGRGVIVEPERPCNCYYGKVCTNKAYQCMQYLYPNQVLNAIYKLEARDGA